MYQGCVMTNAGWFFEMDSPGLGLNQGKNVAQQSGFVCF